MSEIIGEGILIQGSGVASGRLLGQSFEDLRLNDVQLEASTGLGAINAKGVISNIEIFSNSDDRSPKLELNVAMSTTNIEKLLERLDQNIPVDGSGTATGLLVTNNDNYSIAVSYTHLTLPTILRV